MPNDSNPHNILLLVTDQHRIDTLGCYGNTVCRTPNLDALAAAGTRFEYAFTPTAICTPARASLVTGVHPFRHKLLANFERNVGYMEELDGTFTPFSAPLHEAGYRTVHVGKWHVGRERGPEECGFEGIHYPGWGNAVQHPDYLSYLEERGLPPYRIRDEIRPAFPNGGPGNLLAAVLDQPVEATFEYFLAERTIQHVRALAEGTGHGELFFFACHWFGPHLPYCLPQAYAGMYDPDDVELPASIAETFEGKPEVQRQYSAHWGFDSLTLADWRKLTAMYWGYVTLIDEQVGRVLNAVRELGLWESTAVMFSADHGEFTGAHRLNDKGPAMYDDIYRIPLIARIPGAPEGRVDRRFASWLDLTPTILDLAGATIPAHYDGHSLRPLIEGEEDLPWRTHIRAEFHGHHFPYPQRMIRTDRYKLVVNPADINELYDFEADPHELSNRYEHPEMAGIRRELLGRLYTELRTEGDNFYHWMTTMYDVGLPDYDPSLALTSTTSRGAPA